MEMFTHLFSAVDHTHSVLLHVRPGDGGKAYENTPPGLAEGSHPRAVINFALAAWVYAQRYPASRPTTAGD